MIISKQNFSAKKNGTKIYVGLSIVIFLIFVPLVSKISFMQNDDWVHYRTVLRFLSGNFSLEPVIGSTFFSQGILGFVFAKFFKISSLPMLTLGISVSNFFVFSVILKKYFKISIFLACVLGLLLFFNPIHFYLFLGFMIEDFLLFFVLLSVYFYFEYIASSKNIYLITSILAAVLAFFTKQLGILVLLAYSFDLLRKRKPKKSVVTFIPFIFLLAYYFFMFPKSSIMLQKGFSFKRLSNLYSLTSSIIQWYIYIISFVLPLIFVFLFQKMSVMLKNGINSKRTIYFLLTSTLLFFVISFFLAGYNYPYLANTFLRTGFFSGGMNGNKYHFFGNYDLFRLWKFISLILGAAFLGYISVYKKHKIKVSFSLIFITLYVSALLIFPYVYDRYLVLLIPFAVFFLVENIKKVSKIGLVALESFVVFTALLSTQYGLDYVSWQKYAWDKAEQLFMSKGVKRNQISSSRAWNMYHEVDGDNVIYKFSFDDPDTFDREDFNLVETHDIKFIGNVFINPKVYLYKRSNESK